MDPKHPSNYASKSSGTRLKGPEKVPWETPTLKEIRGLVRDNVRSSLPGADASVPNSVLRVLSDAQGALAHLTLQYIDWLSLQLLPDTAETEWLDRHGAIWLVNADGSTGRKQATFAAGIVSFTGVLSTIVPIGTRLQGENTVAYETTAEITLGSVPTEAPARALDPGTIGNLEMGDGLGLITAVPGVDGTVTIVEMTGGVDTENDDDLRDRILRRIQKPPMGGDDDDYVAWALAVPGVTRAWTSPGEMGIGTVTVRFMMDDLRASSGGFPNADDIALVTAYIDSKRPVTVKDRFILAPIPEPIDFKISNLYHDTDSVRAAIEVSAKAMLRQLAAPAHSINGVPQPAQTIYAAWVSEAIMQTLDVISFTLEMDDQEMPYKGSLAVLGTIVYDNS